MWFGRLRVWTMAGAAVVCGGLASVGHGAIVTPDHVVVVIEENHDYNQIIGNADAPYINQLANTGLSYYDSHAVAFNSLVNYLDLFSGSNQGVTDDTDNLFSAPNLGSALQAAGRSFAGYAQSLPADGFTGASAPDYVRIHNPWTYFANLFVGGSNAAVNKVFNETNFPTSPGTDYAFLPAVAFVVPNLLNDMHGEDGGTLTDAQLIAAGDGWLQSNLDAYAQWAQSHRSLMVVTWDENDYTGTNHIPTIVTGDPSLLRAGLSGQTINHFNVLRALEDMYGLTPLGGSADAAPLATDAAGALTPSPALLVGDADGDGKVDFADLVILARNYGNSTATWSEGDFNADGSVGFDDLVMLARNYGKSLSAPAVTAPAAFTASAAPLPDPSVITLLAIPPCALGRGRRKSPSSRRPPVVLPGLWTATRPVALVAYLSGGPL